jgi:hypothetical protein
VTLSDLVLPSSSIANCRTSGCDTTVLHLQCASPTRWPLLRVRRRASNHTNGVPLASRTQGWPTRWPRQLTSPHSFSTHRTEQRILSNITLHTSPAIAIASLHFSLLTRTGSCFLSLSVPVSHILSVQCIAYRTITFCPGPLFAAAFLLLELQKQPSPRPPIYFGGMPVRTSSQASTHMQLSSRCQITLQTHRPHSSACCSILRLAKGQRDT